MGDLIALNGPWQAITFLNFFKAEYYEREEPNSTVVFYEINDELKEVCRLLLSQYDFINHIIDIKDIDLIYNSSFSKLWIGKLFSIESKFIVDFFPTLPIILFEEGLHSYTIKKKFTFSNISQNSVNTKERLKMLYNFIFKKSLLYKKFPELIFPRHRKRCIRNYYLFPLLKVTSRKDVFCHIYIKELLQDAQRILDTQSILKSKKQCVIVIGQYFSNLGLLSYDYELSVYLKILNYYYQKGFHLYWKGHPRNKSFDQKVKESFGERIEVFENNHIPLEIFLLSNSDIEVCGISSSVLVYHSLLSNGKTKHGLDLVKNELNKNSRWYRDFLDIFSIVESNIDRIDI